MDKFKELLNWSNEKISSVVDNLDHKHPTKITWMEFVDWFANVGKVRDKIHDAKLYKSGLTRLT